ncbi:MAG: AsnC family transcriptional regulator [Flavobacteriales bacterium CG_4_10_14_0_2_um_filter_32_8]|nr:MAG: AsnC family transcriptional regulator [Flavobacteriales bacterium CG_4_10_14_0_2_um_filter_32_8]PJB14054.1 MAG: AsnC family transcriptional regulator [Flavobacteriales bacterium CG_4_9_14_3_um_filter_32_8]
MKLDEIDLNILKRLQENGKITNLQLSKDIGLSPAPTLERVKKLENSGFILSYHALVDEAKLELGICAYMQISLIRQRDNAINNFIAQINKIDEVLECYNVTGQADYLLKIMVKDIAAFDVLVKEKLTPIEEIRNMHSMVVISKDKYSKVLPYNY